MTFSEAASRFPSDVSPPAVLDERLGGGLGSEVAKGMRRRRCSHRVGVRATVHARVVTVLGRLEGHIAADLVDIGPDALVDASVITKQLALEEGARFNGAVNTERARAAGEVARRKSGMGGSSA